jgi:hypothetical protein
VTSNKSSSTIAQLKALGFSDEAVLPPRRIIASISGHEKSGKTHFTLTAPDPIFYFDMDNGAEGVIHKFKSLGKKIYTYPVSLSKTTSQAKHKETWDGVKAAILKVCEHNQGTGILDTSSEMYELARLARFGKLEQVLPHHYSLVNAEWQKEILQAMYDSSMNWILIHRVKPVWLNDKRTGKFEMAGFADTGYKVQLKITAFRETLLDEDGVKSVQFGISIDDCRNPARLIGKEYRSVLPIDSEDFQIDPILNFDTLLDEVHGAAF